MATRECRSCGGNVETHRKGAASRFVPHTAPCGLPCRGAGAKGVAHGQLYCERCGYRAPPRELLS